MMHRSTRHPRAARLRVLALLSLLALFSTACGDLAGLPVGAAPEGETPVEPVADEQPAAPEQPADPAQPDDPKEKADPEQPADPKAPADDADDAADAGLGLATVDERLATLDELIALAGLSDALTQAAPVTVFGPTNEAFDALGEDALAALAADPAALAEVLQYHVVEGAVTSDDLTDGQVLTTLAGGTLTVSVAGEAIMLTDATGEASTVETPDLAADDFTIHVIDRVLQPAADAPSECASEKDASGDCAADKPATSEKPDAGEEPAQPVADPAAPADVQPITAMQVKQVCADAAAREATVAELSALFDTPAEVIEELCSKVVTAEA